jgi:AraC-like DNA-binding protein
MTVSILLARALVAGVETAGVSRAAFLEQAGLTPEDLDDVEARLEVGEYLAMVELALDVTGDDALGLHLGLAASAETYCVIGPLVSHATTLRKGLEAVSRFHRLLSDRMPMRVIEDDRIVTLTFPIRAGSDRCRRFWAEDAMAGLYRMVRYFARDAKVDCVAFEHAAPGYRDEYTRAFDGVERFEQTFTGLVFDRKLMDAAQPNQDPEFHSALETQAERRVARLTGNLTYAERLRDQVIAAPALRDMEAAARALGMTSRSLRRRLHEEGVLYNDVVERALTALAKELLVDDRRSVQQIAYDMSFSEPSAFCRAFKRWTGSTPSQYRMQAAPSLVARPR